MARGLKALFLSGLLSLSQALAAQVPDPARQQEFVLPPDISGRTILFVGAHPDDEWGTAPILAEACLERGARCHFVVVAEARSYGCLLTIGLKDAEQCSRMRREEMKASAALFGGDAEFLGLDDLFYAYDDLGVQHVIADWSASSGGYDRLTGRLAAIVEREQPVMILTLDPRHGSSCHSGHRAAASLLLAALRTLPESNRPPVWLEQTADAEERVPDAKAIIDAGGYVGWPDTARETVWYDANHRLPSGRAAYDYALLVRRAHASQYPDEASGKEMPNPPAAYRRVPLARYTPTTSGDYCTVLRLDRPTLDIPANRKRFGIEP